MRSLCLLLFCAAVGCSADGSISAGNGNDLVPQTGPCRFLGSVMHVTLDPNAVLVLHKGASNALLMNEQNCYGASVSNVRAILIDESAVGPQSVTLDFSTGFFGLANATGGGITLNYGTDKDDVLNLVFPNTASRTVAGANGFNVNGDNFVDIALGTTPATVTVLLGPNSDSFQAGGDAVTGAPFAAPLNISGGNGNDTLQGGGSSDHLMGDGGADLLMAGLASDGDIFEGGDGVDTVSFALRVNDLVAGFDANSGVDNIYDDIEVLIGGDGNDTLSGSPNVLMAKVIKGGNGDDVFKQSNAAGPDSSDTIRGGNGNDTIDYTVRTVPVWVSLDGLPNDGSGEQDNIGGDVENIRSGSGNDSLYGNANSNTFFAGGGNNLIMGGAGDDIFLQGQDGDLGNDTIFGGDGSDWIDYRERTTPLTVVLDGVTACGATGAESDILNELENVIGGMANDSITGNPNNNWLYGMAGDDTLDGQAGDDLLDGGDGVNTLICGPGNDIAQNWTTDSDCELD